MARDWLEFLQDMEQWSRDLDRFMTHVSNRSSSWTLISPLNVVTWSPAVNIYETEDSLLVLAELAGVSPENIYIKQEGNRLLVWGQRRQPDLEMIRAVHRLEIQMGTFAFFVDLPGMVSADGAEAQLEAGFLQIWLPKRSAAESGMITIKTRTGVKEDRDLGKEQ